MISPSNRQLYATYAAGFFSLGLVPIASLITPLWAIQIGASPAEIGYAIAARNVFPVLLSIYSGALIDRRGARRVMTVAGTVTAGFALLFPMFPSVWAIVVIMLFLGFAQAVMWIGTQAVAARIGKDDPTIIARFSFMTTFGNFVGPIVAGIAWDGYNAWGGFGFLAAWSAVLLLCVQAFPNDRVRSDSGAAGVFGGLLTAAEAYVSAFRLYLVPAVMFVLTCSMFLGATMGIRHSFYPVYLHSVDLAGTTIGILVGAMSLTGSVAGLAAPRVANLVAPHWLLLISVLLGAAGMTAAPLASDVGVLALFAILAGIGTGLTFPLMLSALARSVAPSQQGLTVGLRITLNRLVSLIIPVVMGHLAEAAGLATAFYAMFAVIAGAALLLAVTVGRTLARPGD